MSLIEGLVTMPLLKPHSPPRTLNRLDLPQPFGPVTIRFYPYSILKDIESTKTNPLGVIT